VFWPEDLSIQTMGGQPSYIHCQTPGCHQRPVGARIYLMSCIGSYYYPVDHRPESIFWL
jgi:hypothetical protein